jgi:PBP1b-binding outer membrane lipoprotein LpoB
MRRFSAGRHVQLLLLASLILTGCSEVLEPVQGLGDALKGLFESLPF